MKIPKAIPQIALKIKEKIASEKVAAKASATTFETLFESNTYVSDDALDENGHIDYTKLNLVLFEMPTYSYLEMGPVIGKCMKMH